MVLAGLLLATAPGALAATPWSGYLIDETGRADGGLIGARKAGEQVVYRTDADARAVTTRYRPVVARSGGRSLSRAAWILSVYGAVRVADQAAAVDLATYALLSGKAIGGDRARARLRQTGRAAPIRDLARSMLRESTRKAGPYRVRISARGVDVGEPVVVRVRVTTTKGRALGNAAVRLRVGDEIRRQRTSAGGRVRLEVTGKAPGWVPVRVKVARVPQWRLLLRPPKKRAASPVAVAGRTTHLRARDRVAVRARPQVQAGGGEALVGRDLVGRIRLTGVQGAPRVQAKVDLHGPFATPTASCAGDPVARQRVSVAGDGAYQTLPLRPASAGYYAWRVVVPRSELNTRAETCGGVVRVRAVPRLSLEALATTKPGSRLRFDVAALPATYVVAAEARLYGPFKEKANVACRAAKRVTSTSVPVDGPGRYAVARVPLSRPGFYVWRVRTPPTELAVAVTAGCGGSGSVVRIR